MDGEPHQVEDENEFDGGQKDDSGGEKESDQAKHLRVDQVQNTPRNAKKEKNGTKTWKASNGSRTSGYNRCPNKMIYKKKSHIRLRHVTIT